MKPHAFSPRLLALRQGYSLERLGHDVGAGLTVAMVALPLAMAFAIASGLQPQAGLFTAIIAGFLISALGGSTVQIGGPAGAFIVVVYGILTRYGLANLVIATAMSGVLLFLMGLFKLGQLIRFIPVTVVIGFTNGIAVLIGLSQIKDFLGLPVAQMPADFFGMLHTLGRSLGDFNPAALALASAGLLLLWAWQRLLPRLTPAGHGLRHLQKVPGTLLVLVLSTLLVAWWELPVQTLGSRFGGIPSALPHWDWPDFHWATVQHLLMPASTLALLGAIESLLCARVADGLTQQHHDPNQELMAQGLANLVTPFLGGMPATGTIARTVTNIQSGATSPVAGMVHALSLLLIVWLAAPLAVGIPLPTLAAILMFVAWNMGEWREFVRLRRFALTYQATLLSVFALTVIVDLTVAVEVGLVAAILTFLYRISSLSRCEVLDAASEPALAGQGGHLSVVRLYGALFFGAVALVEDLEAQLPAQALVLDLKNLIYIDNSGAEALLGLLLLCERQGVRLLVCGLAHQPHEMATRCGLIQRLQDPARGGALHADMAEGVAAGLRLCRAGPPGPLKSA